jgi:glycosyltransferase involved in cell wall biosynthesis
LIDYLKANYNEYTVFIFFTSIYYPTALGVLEVAKKSILIPTLHDELVSYFSGYKKTMAAAEWIFFNTEAEKILAEKLFPILTTKKQIVAVGVDLYEKNGNEELLLKKVDVTQPYLVYVGRIDYGKGCDMLIEYFIKCIEELKLNISLVMVGKINMSKIKHPSIIYTDFVDDETKAALMQQALALVIPSEFESLSLVLLESFACKTPVIANGKSAVLKNHITTSNGGWYFENYNEFKNIILNSCKTPNENDIKAENGFNYVAKNYSWQNVVSKFIGAIEDIEKVNKN